MRAISHSKVHAIGVVALMASLSLACAENSWEAVRQQDSATTYHQFVRDNPESPFLAEANERIEYLRVRSHPGIDAFDRFREAYPQSALTEELNALVEPFYFDRARQANTAAAYHAFMARYPAGPLAARAQGNLVYVETVREAPSRAGLRAFLDEHFESDFAPEARSALELLDVHRSTRIDRLGIRVEVAASVTQPERVRRGFTAMVAREYRKLGVEAVAIPPGGAAPDGVDAWVRIDYHEAQASGVLGGSTLLSNCRMRLYQSDSADPIWDRSFSAPADHVLQGAYGRDKTLFGNSRYSFWENFFVPVSTWATSRTRVQRLDYAEDVEAIDIRGDRAAVLLGRGGVDFLDVSTPQEPKVIGRYRRERDLSSWSGIKLLKDDLIVSYGPNGVELVRWDSTHATRLAVFESPEVGKVRSAALYNDDTLLFVGTGGLFAVRINLKQPEPHRLLDGEFVGIEVSGPYIYAMRPDRLEIASAKHLLRHIVGRRIAFSKGFGAWKARLVGGSLYAFGTDEVVRFDLSSPTHPQLAQQLKPEEVGQIVDLSTDLEHLYLLGSRGLQVLPFGGQPGADFIHVDADEEILLKGRFAFLVGDRTLEILDLAPYRQSPANPGATQ